MKLTILLALAAVTIGVAQIDPWFTTLVNLVPTPDPCGYTEGRAGCVKHKLVCPVW